MPASEPLRSRESRWHDLVVFSRRKKQASPESESPFDVYLGLRGIALGAYAQGVSGDATDAPAVAAMIVDIPASGGHVTVVALADGTTSMYTSVGGGTIGAGSDAHVAAASHELLAVAAAHRDRFTMAEDPALPSGPVVRFHGFGPAGPLIADVPEDAFWGRAAHPLLPVIAATQEVISAISSVSGGNGPD
jgi:hypothetical protein